MDKDGNATNRSATGATGSGTSGNMTAEQIGVRDATVNFLKDLTSMISTIGEAFRQPANEGEEDGSAPATDPTADTPKPSGDSSPGVPSHQGGAGSHGAPGSARRGDNATGLPGTNKTGRSN